MRKSKMMLIGVLSVNAVACVIALFHLPPEAKLGHLYKIIYVHVPLAWVSYVAFTTALVSGILYIVKKEGKYDLLSYSSVTLGVVFSGLAILLGSIFSSKAWGTYWEWREPRMTSTLILFLAYVGYLALRESIGDLEKRRRISAVYSIMAFVTVPLSYVAVKMFRSLHPLPELSPEMRLMLYVTFLTNVLVYIIMLRLLYHRSLAWERTILEV